MRKYIKQLFIPIILLLGISQINAQSIMNSESIMALNDTLKLRATSEDLDIDISKITKPIIIPPSPQAQIFQKYINHPTVESNGLPQINIPLYEIQINGMKIPISLSYHASGIKFKQYDGDVAAGWSINVGGYRISRTIRGRGDTTGRYDSDVLKSNSLSYVKEAYLGVLSMENDCPFGFFQVLDRHNIPYTNAAIMDTEYDIFTYSTPTTSGHYLITDIKTGETDILEQNQDIMTHASSSRTLKDGQGNIFRFDSGTERSGGGEITSWVLSELLTNKNEKINFSYIGKFIPNTGYGNMGTFTISEAPDKVNEVTEEAGQNYTFNSSYEQEPYAQTPTLEASFIDQIETDYENILFIRDTSNKEKPYLLKQIVIKTKDGQEIKNINLELILKDWHWLLGSVSINSDLKSEKKYTFEYYDGPKNIENAYYDLWGYYKQNSIYSNKDVFLDKLFEEDQFKYFTSYSSSQNRQETKPFNYALNLMNNNMSSNSKLPRFRFVDRLNSELSPNYYSLKKIYFPTGGTEEYEYESHQYLDRNNKVKYGGGLRISKIISKSDPETKSITSIYKYGKNENGISNTDKYINDFYKQFVNETTVLDCRLHHAYGRNPPSFILLSQIRTYSSSEQGESAPFYEFTYDQVNIYKGSGNEGGKSISIYIPSGKYETDISTSPTYSYSNSKYYEDLYIRRNKPAYKEDLYKRIYLNNNNDTVKVEIYDYINTKEKEYESLKIWPKIFLSNTQDVDLNPELCSNPNTGYRCNSFYQFITSLFKASYYNTVSGTRLLSQKKDITYLNNKASIIATESYAYNDKNQITKMTQVITSTKNLIKEFKYPQNFAVGNNVYSQMVSKNMLSPVIEQITKQGDKEISKIKSEYTIDQDRTKGLILPESVQTSYGGGSRTDIIYNRYDNKGNILQYTTLDGIKTCYLWGYNGHYPIAKIENATYDDVKTALGVTPESLSSATTPDFSKLAALRTHTKLADALITTYTYKPLVGILTMTDPREVTTHYEYDTFGRLKGTYIQEKGSSIKKAIQTNDYHYQNQ